MYSEEDYLQLSGIQHFLFCRRQWALIHLENQWAENLRTVEGHLFHKRAHDSGIRTRRGDVLTVRDLRIHSAKMGLSGACDVVEFHLSPNGISLAETDGLWTPYPIEYKRGAPKSSEVDTAQLCAQAMCLEEMLCTEIREGAVFYGETRRRLPVVFTPELRAQVESAAKDMHELFRRGHTPKVKRSKSCNACSLKDVCLPSLLRTSNVAEYMQRGLED